MFTFKLYINICRYWDLVMLKYKNVYVQLRHALRHAWYAITLSFIRNNREKIRMKLFNFDFVIFQILRFRCIFFFARKIFVCLCTLQKNMQFFCYIAINKSIFFIFGFFFSFYHSFSLISLNTNEPSNFYLSFSCPV